MGRRVTVACLLAVAAFGAWPGSPLDFADSLRAAPQRRPIAVAGLNQVIAGIGIPVQLDGTASSDPGGSPLTYQWTFVEAPTGSAVVLAGAGAARPTFVPDVKGRYRLQLVVSTALATSRPDLVAITVRNTAPSADAGDALFAAVGDLVRLDGSRSSDADGDSLSFHWGFLSKPRGSGPRFDDATAIQPAFLVDKPGRYIARLVVHDGRTRGSDAVVIDVPNTPPAANAGPDRTAVVGERVRLDGSGSADSDGDRLSYEWALVAIPDGSSATLLNPTAVRPRFVVDRPGRYVAQLTVSDGLAASAPDTIVISTGNSAPVAHAGPDLSALTGQTVQLNGGGSSDIDGDELTYLWTLAGKPEDSSAVLDESTVVNPRFQVDRRGSYLLQLVVHDGAEPSRPDEVVVTVGNSAPVANAGADRRVTVGDSVALDGSGSTDVDGDRLAFHWSLTLAPAGSEAALDDPDAVRPTFDVDRPGTYVAQLLVSDGTAFSAADTVTIDTENVAPISNAGPDQSAYVGQLVALTGADSRDPDGAPVTFTWSFASRPAGSSAELTGAMTLGPAFTVDLPGEYVVQLIVSDGELASAPDTVTVTTRANTPPAANAGADVDDVAVGSEVVLNGSASSDADGHPLTYRWSLLTRPTGSAAALSDPTVVFPYFTADVVGDYVAQLVVGDGLNESAPDTVLIRTARPPVVANAGPDQVVDTGTSVQLDGSGSSDTSGQLLTFQWRFVSVPSGSQAVLSSTDAVDPAFVADVAGTYELLLTVTDAFGASATDSVTIAAVASQPPVVSVFASDSSAEEAGSNDATFVITRSEPHSGALTVNVAVGGTAMNGSDYAGVPLATVIPDGEASVTLQIEALPDLEVEGDETVVLTLEPGDYTIGEPNSATVIITDADAPVIDPTFVAATSVQGGAVGSVHTIAVQADGKVLIGGSFDAVNGVPRRALARLWPDGTLDASFTTGETAPVTLRPVRALAVQQDGKILVGGEFTGMGGLTRNGLARLLPDGTVDTTFAPDLGGNQDHVHAIVIQPDGRILIAGRFSSVNGVRRLFFARLLMNGALDETFAPSLAFGRPTGGVVRLSRLGLQRDGRIIVANGQMTAASGVTRNRIARLNPDGSLDETFDPDPNGDILAIAVRPDGRIVLAGGFSSIAGTPSDGIVQVLADGSVDAGFSAGTNGSVAEVLLQPDHRLLVAGNFGTLSGGSAVDVGRLNPDGSLDTTFGPFPPTQNSSISALALQPDGKVLVGGAFGHSPPMTNRNIARLNSFVLPPLTDESLRAGLRLTRPLQIAGLRSRNPAWRILSPFPDDPRGGFQPMRAGLHSEPRHASLRHGRDGPGGRPAPVALLVCSTKTCLHPRRESCVLAHSHQTET